MLGKIRKAPEIEWDNPKQWINSKPLNLSDLKGKVILIDFWTYTCINCVRTFPALKLIWDKYKNKRFVLFGVHTPEFEFEKEIGNVKYAVKKYGLSWPILNDPKRINWENYGNSYWPRAALINPEGKIIFEHIGESGYKEIDEKIAGELVRLRDFPSDSDIILEKQREYSPRISHETYAGSLRNGEITGKVCSLNGSCDKYVDSGSYKSGEIYLNGEWHQGKEYAEYLGKDSSGWIAYLYNAKEVNVVLSGAGRAEVTLNEIPLKKSNAGEDIIFNDGKSFVNITGGDMYRVISHPNVQSGVLKIKSFPEMKFFAYTFG